MSAPIRVEVDGLGKDFVGPDGRFTAVRDQTFAIDGGTRIGLIGESGSGKSTLARMIAGLATPTRGTVHVDGRDVHRLLATRAGRTEHWRAVQMVAQDTTSSFDPRRTLRDAVATPAVRLCGLTTVEANRRVDETLAFLSLPAALADRRPSDLSGGQRQRFALARALVVRPRLLVCDEVVSALDVSVQGTILNLLKNYSLEFGAAMLFVSHGLPATAFVSTSLMVMRAGAVVESGPVESVVTAPAHPYTRQLIAAYRGTPMAVAS
ncbi:ABC transporter ATP-binding protein [Pseudonocardia pini]|uniref:ABC transporter ATP-binding protein n=1 Tax=Pseudonocardia pini TaxID=2758030 RepID=UPI0015F0C50F|nr:ATP-binding cassette domain-containing protein [Pseudonocardia pini]